MIESATRSASMEHLQEQLLAEQQQNKVLKSRVDELQMALESADINYEMFKQKCMVQFENFQNEMANMKKDFEQMLQATRQLAQPQRQDLRKLHKCAEENNRNIIDVDLRLQLLENSRMNGKLLWKIDDFRQRRQQTLVGDISALHSAPCYTSEYGYKFCLRAYLNGDGVGEGTHLSLFLVIMTSDYDNILEWPFQKKFKFTLINQQNRSKDHVEEIIPKKGSESFQKPKKEMNIASGCPMFIELNRLDIDGFLKDDCLFFEVDVEQNDNIEKNM